MNPPFLDPKEIIVNRDARQRTDVLDTSEIAESIARVGLIQPIVVERRRENIILVAGERRLRACLDLNLTSIPVVFKENLSQIKLRLIELEENIKRKDLPWQDKAKAINELHFDFKENEERALWTISDTAREIGLDYQVVWNNLKVAEFLSNDNINSCENLSQALSVINRWNERRATEAISEIFDEIAILFAERQSETGSKRENSFNEDYNKNVLPSSANPSLAPNTNGPVSISHSENFVGSYYVQQIPAKETNPILNEDFLEWAAVYDGPKFNLIHCDFPYGVRLQGEHALAEPDPYDNDPEIYWALTDTLCNNVNKIFSYSANMLFWFSMNYYTETLSRLRGAGFHVRNHPLIWYHSDNKGTVPNRGTEPRRVYDTAFLCTLGSRPLLTQIATLIPAATVAHYIHPSQKPFLMLKAFFTGLCDETIFFLDPTAGSGSALIAAEELGAKYVLGLEQDPDFCKAGNGNVIRARALRKASRVNKET